VTHDDYFAVVLFQLIQSDEKTLLHFSAKSGCRGCEFCIFQQSCQVCGRLFIVAEAAHVLLPIHRAALGGSMASVHINDAIFGQLAQPKMERHHRICQIVLQTLRRFHQDVLHDIAGIDATSHGLIESHLDHAPNRLPMPIHQAIDSLRINADNYTVSDDTMIPTGEIAPVEGTDLDFRKRTVIGKRIESIGKTAAIGYDHNFVLNPREEGKTMTLAAIVVERESGRRMHVMTTEPGIQFYSGNFLKGQKGKGGKTYAHRSALCLETQHYPDSVNHENFPTTILKPGEKYESKTTYAFEIEKPEPAKN